MIEKIYGEIVNLMLRICNLTDNSFLSLFIFYMVVYFSIGLISTNIEGYLGIEKKVYLRDLIILFILFAIFAFNTFHLSRIKQMENSSYQITKRGGERCLTK